MAIRKAAPLDSGEDRAGESAEPLAAAFARGWQLRAQLLQAEGGTLTVTEVARRLGLTRQAVEQQRRAGHLLALPTERRRYAYPAWQFTPDGVLPGLVDTLADLQVRSPWMRAAFFLGRNVYLDGASPLGELRRGRVAAVRRAAQAYGEHGAA
jgi:hypothetical protein